MIPAAFYFTGTFAKLSEMVRRGNQAIKAVDPTAKIICPLLPYGGFRCKHGRRFFNRYDDGFDGEFGE